MLIRIYGPVVEQEMWRIRTNQELRELCKDLNIVTNIKKKKLEWIEHVVRMDQGRTVKKILESKPEESRRRGNPRLRWLKDEEKDLWETKVRRWRKSAFNREKWVSMYDFILYHCTYGCMFCMLLVNFVNYAYCYVCSVLGILFHCVVLCIVCV
jgi:hypothetical protein